MIKRLLSKIYILWVKRSSDSYCNYLRSKGLKIGENVKINPKHCIIDTFLTAAHQAPPSKGFSMQEY